MNSDKFVRRIPPLGRERGVSSPLEARAGKGSRGRLYHGERFATVKDRRKEIGARLLSAMLRQLGPSREGLG